MSIYDRDYFRTRYNTRVHPNNSIIKKIIIANVIVYAFCHFTGDTGNQLGNFLALTPMGIQHFQVWRLFTYMFVHANFWHIFFNMYALYIFGKLLEQPLGAKRFSILYFCSGLIGAVLWLGFNWTAFAACIGASGAVFGVMVASAMAFPDAQFMLIIPPMPVKLWALVWVYCAIEVLASFNSGSGIAHLAHLGGALGGFIYMRRLGCHMKSPQLRKIVTAIQKFWRGLWFSQKHTAPRSFPGGDPSNSAPIEFDSTELNRILDKISLEGYNNLTNRERKILQEASERLKRK